MKLLVPITDNYIHTSVSTFFIPATPQFCIDFPEGVNDIERSVIKEESCRTRIRAQKTQDARDAVKVLCLAERWEWPALCYYCSLEHAVARFRPYMHSSSTKGSTSVVLWQYRGKAPAPQLIVTNCLSPFRSGARACSGDVTSQSCVQERLATIWI